jgi:hypothetical protein
VITVEREIRSPILVCICLREEGHCAYESSKEGKEQKVCRFVTEQMRMRVFQDAVETS